MFFIINDRFWLVYLPFTKISCRIPSGSHSSPIHACSRIPFQSVCYSIISLTVLFVSPHDLHMLSSFNFRFYFRFLTILRWVFTQDLTRVFTQASLPSVFIQDLARGKVGIKCILPIYVFCCLFWVIFLVTLIVFFKGDEEFCKG